jgi:hypothetical protein
VPEKKIYNPPIVAMYKAERIRVMSANEILNLYASNYPRRVKVTKTASTTI